MLKDQTHDLSKTSRRSETLTFMVKRDVKSLLEEGKRFFDEGEVGKAVNVYGQALEADPECALVYFNLGFAFHELKDYAKARQHYSKAVELEPACSLFLEHLGRLHFERGDYAAAISSFQKAIEVGQVQPITFGLLGRAYYKSENYEAAAEQLAKMLQVETNPSLVNVARYHLVLSMLRQSDMFIARAEAEVLVKADGCDHDILQNLGDEFSRHECISLAKRFFERLEQEEGSSVLARNTVEKIQGIEVRIDEILPRLYDNDEERVLRSMHALMDVGHEKVARAILSLRQSDSPLVRESVIEYMRKFGFQAAPQIVELIEDPADFVREKATHYLAEARPMGIEDKLIPHLKDESAGVRRNLATYFARVGSSTCLSFLQVALNSEQDENVREALQFALDRIRSREEIVEIETVTAKSPDIRVYGRRPFPLIRYGMVCFIGAGIVAAVLWQVF